MGKLTKFSLTLLSALSVGNYGMNRTDLTDLTSTVSLPTAANQSEFCQLPAERIQDILSYLSNKDRADFALGSEEFRDYVQSHIRELIIPLEDITPALLKNARERFPAIRRLTIKGRRVTPEHIALLAQAFPRIQSLNLENTGLSVESVIALSLPDTFTSLRTLNLGQNFSLGDKVIAILGGASFSGQLESLTLDTIGLTPIGVKNLSKPGAFTALKALSLAWNDGIQDEGVNYLSQFPLANQLESLNLENTGMTAQGVQTITQSNNFRLLKKLTLNSNKNVGDQAIEYLSQAPFADQLEVLNVAQAGITAEGVRMLSQSGVFKSLKELRLASNVEIRDQGVAYLVQAPFASKLELLDLGNTNLTTESLRALSNPEVFKALKVLRLVANKNIEHEATQYLRETLSGRQLEILD